MKTFFLCIINLLWIVSSYSQPRFSRQYIRFYLKKMYSVDTISPQCIYQIDRHVYTSADSLQLDSSLHSLLFGKVYSIEYSHPDVTKYPNGLVILRTVGSQSRKEIEKLFSIGKSKFVDRYSGPAEVLPNAKDPSLIIDDYDEYRPWRSKALINRISVNDISAIKIWNIPVNYLDLHEENRKNGCVQI